MGQNNNPLPPSRKAQSTSLPMPLPMPFIKATLFMLACQCLGTGQPEAVTVALRDDQTHMRLAIQEARRSRGEENRIHPYVGAVVVRSGQVIGTACRGDQDPRDHAEFGVLEKKLPRERLAGSTVYTTLEPCTTRNHPKVTCADRLIERRVSRVVIGMLDPDQRITGKGVLKLRRAVSL